MHSSFGIMAVSKESRDKAPVTPEGRPRDRSQSEESRDGPGREERARKDDDPERRHRDNDDDRRRADDDDKPEGREASEDVRAAKDKYGSNVCETCKKEVRGGKAGMRLHKETSKLHWQYVYWQRGMPWEQAKARAAREWEKAMSPTARVVAVMMTTMATRATTNRRPNCEAAAAAAELKRASLAAGAETLRRTSLAPGAAALAPLASGRELPKTRRTWCCGTLR